jgi:O-antigen ligase
MSIFLFVMLALTTATVWVRQAWALQIFQIGIFALVGVQVLRGIRSNRQKSTVDVFALVVYLIPMWGVFQIATHTTSSNFETREAVLLWGSLSGVFYLNHTINRPKSYRRRFLTAALWFGTAIAALCLLQVGSSHGRVLWIFQTDYSEIYATFQNKNNFSQFVELVFPIALWRAVNKGWRSWGYALAGGVLYASAIGAASRAGFLLCTWELIAIVAIGLVRLGHTESKLSRRAIVSIVLMVPIVAGTFTFAVGWGPILERFKNDDPYAVRREFLLGAVDMVKHRPLTGYGLGTFEQVYQKYAIKDDPFYANHAHNDWAEFAADGGIPFLLLVLVPFLAAVPTSFRHPWGLGLLATMINACVDYPFPRPAVSGWMFAILGALYAARWSDRKTQRSESPTN